MRKALIISTNRDISLYLFAEKQAASIIQPVFTTYNEVLSPKSKSLNSAYDYLYLRDPFNDDGTSETTAKSAAEMALNKLSSTYVVDNVSNFNDLLLEDKWLQYQKFKKHMPVTRLVKSFDEKLDTNELIKKRVSSRSKGIAFSKKDLPAKARPPVYIVQQLLDIEIEYRVYIVGGEIIEPIAIKSTKTQKQKAKIIGLTSTVPNEIKVISNAVYKQTNYDFMGLDIAKTKDGYYLLETNRSCQFDGYFKQSSINLACNLNKFLISK